MAMMRQVESRENKEASRAARALYFRVVRAAIERGDIARPSRGWWRNVEWVKPGK